MGLISMVDKVKPQFEYDEVAKAWFCSLCINNEQFFGMGWSRVATEDKEFESSLIGQHIAHLRAQIDLFYDIYLNLGIQYRHFKNIYDNIIKEHPDADSTGIFKKHLDRIKNKQKAVKSAQKKKKKECFLYLEQIDKTFDKLRKYRAEKDNNAN